MLFSLTTTEDAVTALKHWRDVPFVAGRSVIEFKPGLTVVFGPNGSGKSTLIRTLAMLTHCFQGGTQQITSDSLNDCPMNGLRDADMTFATLEPLLARFQRVACDGDDVRYVAAEQDIGYYASVIDEDFGVDHIQSMLTRKSSSSGEAMWMKVNRVLMTPPRAGKVEVAYRAQVDRLNDLWAPQSAWAQKMLAGRPRKAGEPQQLTLLLDEPDRSLDLRMQAKLWGYLRAFAATGKLQIIVASHSVFALDLPEAHYMETVAGAREALRKVMTDNGFACTGAPPPKTIAELDEAAEKPAEGTQKKTPARRRKP